MDKTAQCDLVNVCARMKRNLFHRMKLPMKLKYPLHHKHTGTGIEDIL